MKLHEFNEPDEKVWLQQAMQNPAFDFLNDPAEDIYKFTDGKPFQDSDHELQAKSTRAKLRIH